MFLARPLLFFTILGLGGAYVRYHISKIERLDASKLEYIEDSIWSNGTRYRVLERAADSSAGSSKVEILSRSSAEGFYGGYSGSTPSHVHEESAEHITVISGKLGYKFIGFGQVMKGELKPGESSFIKKGFPHSLWNADNTTDLLYTLTHQPAGPLGEGFFEDLAALGYEHKSADRVHPLQIMILFYEGDSRITDLPEMLQPVVKKVLLPVARLLGFKSHYPSHRSAAGGSTAADEGARNPKEEASEEEEKDEL